MRKALSNEGKAGFHTVAHISIVPAGHTGGVTQFAEPEEGAAFPRSRRVLLAELAVAMGGRAAEELRQGRGEATMGARGDIQQATMLATDMIESGGLSEAIGPRAVGPTSSEDLKKKVDIEVNKLLQHALSTARAALSKNSRLHAAVAAELVERETLDKEAFGRLAERFG